MNARPSEDTLPKPDSQSASLAQRRLKHINTFYEAFSSYGLAQLKSETWTELLPRYTGGRYLCAGMDLFVFLFRE